MKIITCFMLACFYLWLMASGSASAQTFGTDQLIKPVIIIPTPLLQPKIDKVDEEAQSMADALAEYHWRQKLQAITVPTMLKTATEIKIFQLGFDWRWMSIPLVTLSENSNPRMFHMLKRCQGQVKDIGQPLALCELTLYKNGTVLGSLAFYPDRGAIGVGRTWTFVSRAFTDWMNMLKQPDGLYSAELVPLHAAKSQP